MKSNKMKCFIMHGLFLLLSIANIYTLVVVCMIHFGNSAMSGHQPTWAGLTLVSKC